MNSFALAGMIIGSAAFGAVVGKLLEAYVLAPIINKYEKRKWLRQSKFEAFTKLVEELLSLGLKSKVQDDSWLFMSLATKSILLLEDEELINEIHKFIEDIYRINTNPSLIVTSDIPKEITFTLPGGGIGKKEHLEMGIAISMMEERAIKIAKKLGKNIRSI